MQAGTAIEVRDLRKSFAAPSADVRTLAGRLLSPVGRGVEGALPVLDGISFEIAEGEFFGVVGSNGSGKSTLIRILANIYAADSGTVDVRGLVAPVVELGVGFNPELSARSNVSLGGVTLGLEKAAIEARTEQVLEFAGVERFAEMPLRNFSTGMRTRLAFAVSLEVDPDVLLIDEALAVGDGAFQDRCLAELTSRRDAGKTIVLVSHSISKIRQYCDRALLLVDGQIAEIGDPDRVGVAYRAHVHDAARERHRAPGSSDGAVIDSSSMLGLGPKGSLPRRQPIEADVVLRVIEARDRIGIRLDVRDQDGGVVFSVQEMKEEGVEPGDRVRFRIKCENPLAPGEYEVGIRALSARPGGQPYSDSGAEWTFLAVDGHAERYGGAVEVPADITGTVERAGAPAPAADPPGVVSR
jgi:ABC-type polysaccharide/polyol phosphate transport system ATPase subunit